MLAGNKGGKQDQYAAALGGVNLLRFRGADEPAEVQPVRLAPERAAALEERLLLCDAGASPDSGERHRAVWKRYAEGDAGVRDRLRALRDTAAPARDALVAGDWRGLGELMTKNRELGRGLGGGSETARMDALFAAAEQAGAAGCKSCGAGGGGFVLILCGEGARPAVERALAAEDAQIMPVRFAPRRDGSAVDGESRT